MWQRGSRESFEFNWRFAVDRGDSSQGMKKKTIECHVLSAAKRIDSKALKQILNVKSLRFATSDEVEEKTGCEPGGVPPFGNIFELDLLVDKSIVQNEYMAFNAGERTKSLKMKTKDYIDLLKPRIEEFSV